MPGASLFDLTGDMLQLQDELLALEEYEGRELEGEEAEAYEALVGRLMARFDRWTEDLAAKSDGYVWVIREMEARAAAYKEQAAVFARKRQVQERAAARLKDALKRAMETMGTTKIKGEQWTIGLQNSARSVTVKDEEAAVAAGFGEVVEAFSVDQRAILAAYAEDPARVAAFATVEQGTHVRIR